VRMSSLLLLMTALIQEMLLLPRLLYPVNPFEIYTSAKILVVSRSKLISMATPWAAIFSQGETQKNVLETTASNLDLFSMLILLKDVLPLVGFATAPLLPPRPGLLPPCLPHSPP